MTTVGSEAQQEHARDAHHGDSGGSVAIGHGEEAQNVATGSQGVAAGVRLINADVLDGLAQLEITT